jgi:DNA mismatch repair protein MutL
MILRLLDERTIGKIAAGEVVERPVSVVKELIENAIDAGATRIRVAVRGGGIELIEVVDNGSGITATDLPLAVCRHATSKLASFEDLDRLTTLGFRGEALPSIGAVSALAIRSRTAETQHASLLRVTFGEVAAPVTVGAGQGTAVTARDLFGNVPARRKFLRQPSTEIGYIQRAVSAYAATYPAVAFELVTDGRRAFVTAGSGDALAAATAAWGAEVGRAAILLESLPPSYRVPIVRASSSSSTADGCKIGRSPSPWRRRTTRSSSWDGIRWLPSTSASIPPRSTSTSTPPKPR